MKKFGLAGNNISLSKSPELFKIAYGGKYRYDKIKENDFDQVKEKLRDYAALNITAPFKEDAYRYASELMLQNKGSVSGPAFKTGSTNLLKNKGNFIEAYNTDFLAIILSTANAYFPGLVNYCYENYPDKWYIAVHQYVRKSLPALFGTTPQALIIGMGGAGKTAAVAASEMGFQTAIINRTQSKVMEFSAKHPEYGFIPDTFDDLIPAIKECDLIIYTLPCPVEQLKDLTIEDFTGEDIYGKPCKVLLEANYTSPAFSGDIYNRLSAAGCQYIPGEQWLLYQAVTGYEIMTDEKPDFYAMLSEKKI